MVDYAATQRVATRPRRVRARPRSCATSTGCSSRSRGHHLVRPLGRPGSRRTTSPRPELLRRPPGGLRPDRPRRDGRDDAHRPRLLAEALPARLRTAPVHARADPDARDERPEHAPLDRHRRVPLPALRVRKLLLVLFLAAFLAERGKRIYERQTTTAAIGLAAVPILLVFLQPDFGTAIVYAAILGAARSSRVRAGRSLGAARSRRRRDVRPLDRARHRRRRAQGLSARAITGFTNPSKDPGGATWNITSRSPRSAPRAWTDEVPRATQTNYDFLPEHATDFVFARRPSSAASSA